MPKVSCIIPAYNEGPRIANVLQVVFKHPLIDEVIVVDDCSKDNTAEVVKRFKRVRLIIHGENKGKSQTVVTGINQSMGDFIFLLDADLIGLSPPDISALIEPVISGKADISISLRKNAPWIYKQIKIDFISGERVFPKIFIQDHLNEIQKLARFGLESFLNKLIIKNRYRVKIVYWENVVSLWKYKKGGLLLGLKSDFFMILDILKTISIFGVVYQIIKLSFLKVK